MVMNDPRVTVAEGDEVYGSDGDKLGNVVAANNDYIVVEKGWFFPTDYYIPLSAISTYDDGKIYLNVEKDVALNQGWDQQPTFVEGETVTTTAVTDTAYVDETVPVAPARTARDVDASRMTDDTLTVQAFEEELTATKTTREVGGARIEKDVVSEERVLEVPVTEERLKVVRRTVDRDVAAADANNAFEEVIVDVPLEVEDVQVDKRLRVGEEVVIQKEDVQRTEQVRGTVRREDITVTEATEGAVVNDRDRNVNP